MHAKVRDRETQSLTREVRAGLALRALPGTEGGAHLWVRRGKKRGELSSTEAVWKQPFLDRPAPRSPAQKSWII